MRFLSGLVGAIIGAIVGLMAAFLIAEVGTDGNELAAGINLLIAAPIGLIVGSILGIVSGLFVQHYLSNTEAARPKKLRVIAILCISIPALIGAMIWSGNRQISPPSDAQLLSEFRHNQPTLDRLVAMLQQDKKLQRVDYDWTDPTNPGTIGVSPARIATYRHLLDSISIHRGFYATVGPTEVDFQNWGRGSAISSDTDKGFAYLAQPPAHALNSLDECQPDEENGVKAYRHITGHWYLYYDYLPG